MQVEFQWSDEKPANEDIRAIEENIKNEVAHLLSIGGRDVPSLHITLKQPAMQAVLDGVGRTQNGATLVSFSYELQRGHLAHYKSHA